MYYILNECLVFVFFKQKTTYEMRIRDWSSDVCSSDLIQRRMHVRQRRHVARGVVGEAEEGVEVLGVLHLPVAHLAPCSLRGGHVRRAAEGRRYQAVVETVDHDHRQPGARQRGAGFGNALAHAVRSEEHTSELQSLMRISYAVF